MAHFHIQALASTEPSDSVGLLPTPSLTGECRDGSSLVSATDAAGYTDTRIVTLPKYSATREDDTTFIFSHLGLFLSDAASNSHK